MGSRTTTVCDGAGCAAEHENPVSRGGAVLQRPERGWGTLHASDETTGFPYSYDLCSACIRKITELLGLKTGEELFRERDEMFRAVLPAVDLPAPVPKNCETCGEPYVGDSCYFCPASPPPPLEDPR
jgi:hypothetical protein